MNGRQKNRTLCLYTGARKLYMCVTDFIASDILRADGKRDTKLEILGRHTDEHVHCSESVGGEKDS